MADDAEQLTTQQALDILASLGPANRRGGTAWVNCVNKGEETRVANVARVKIREGYVRKVVHSPRDPNETRVFIEFRLALD